MTASGTKKYSRYHPDYPPFEGNHSKAPIRALPYNGGNRASLLAYALTKPTQEEEHPNLPHRLAPNADSLKLPNEGQDFRHCLYPRYSYDRKMKTLTIFIIYI